MHDTAYDIGTSFLKIYASGKRATIVEVGAMDVNGTLRDGAPDDAVYLGIDVEHGAGVDLVAKPREPLPLRSAFADLVITTSQMEHDSRFWLTFLELCRITKPGGLIYFSAPSNGKYHAHPVDAWRFYPDAGKSLAEWAQENGYPLTLIESFTAARKDALWNDFVCVFYLGSWPPDFHLIFLADQFKSFNVWKFGANQFEAPAEHTEDQHLFFLYQNERDLARASLSELRSRLAEIEVQNRLLTDANRLLKQENDHLIAVQKGSSPAHIEMEKSEESARSDRVPSSALEGETAN